MQVEAPDLPQEEHPNPRPAARPLNSLGSMILLLGVVALVTVVGLQLVRRTQTQPFSGPAPDFTMPLLSSELGSEAEFSLSAMRGTIVVLNFWGSWCLECQTEAPQLEDISQRYAAQGVQVVGVDFRDTERKALEFIDQYGLTYTNGFDVGERITERYNVTGAPETFIIDRNGEIYHFFLGPVTAPELAEKLDALLARESAASAETSANS
jgi:cytochrome c biogenesis protein CcmG/thiol:disulfide interchange protein DsbE